MSATTIAIFVLTVVFLVLLERTVVRYLALNEKKIESEHDKFMIKSGYEQKAAIIVEVGKDDNNNEYKKERTTLYWSFIGSTSPTIEKIDFDLSDNIGRPK